MSAQSLRHLPVGWFGLAMGACGLALVLRTARQVLSIPEALGELVALGGIGLEALLLAAYATKYVRHRDAVVAEFTNPATLGFTGTLPVSMMLAAGCLAPWAERTGAALWWLGAGILVICQVAALARWLRGGIEPSQVNGGWLVVVLGGLPAPLGGLPLGLLSASQALFGVSFVLAPFVAALVIWRLVVGPPLPDALRPSTFILLVPPSLVYVLYGALAGDTPWWTRAAFYLSVVLAAALLVTARGFLRWPFGPAWAAFTFPLDAFCAGALRHAALVPSTGSIALAWLSLALAGAAVALVLGRALGALARGTLLAGPPQPAASGGGTS